MTATEAERGYDTCGATTRRKTACGRPAGWGTEHVGVGRCKLHGGSTPSHAVHAAKVQLAGSIAELVAQHRPDLAAVDPHEALLEVVADTWAMRRALWGLVGGLRSEGGLGYEVERDGSTADGRLVLEWVPADPGALWGPDHQGNARPHVLVGMLHAATEEHLKACKYAIDAGIEERRVRVAESQIEELSEFMRIFVARVLGSLAEVGVAAAQVGAVEQRLPGLMRASFEQLRAGVIDVNESKGA
jgi:hypothetical protein